MAKKLSSSIAHHMKHRKSHKHTKKQAIAIGFSEARKSGVHVPKKKHACPLGTACPMSHEH